MKLFLREDGAIKTYIYSKDVCPDDILNDVRNHAHNAGKIVRDFRTVYSDGPIQYKRPIYYTAEIF